MQGIIVTAEGIGAGIALLTVLAGVVNWTVSKTMDARLGAFRTDMERWINGSFMRSAVVGEQLKSLDQRLGHIETNGCARRADHE